MWKRFKNVQFPYCLLPSLILLAALGSAAAQPGIQPVTTFPTATPVGQTSPPLMLIVNLAFAGSASGMTATTQGVSDYDFLISPGGTCSAGTVYESGQQCTVNVTFRPRGAGRRQGSVSVVEADGTVLGSALLAGIGSGPIEVIAPGQITTVAGSAQVGFSGDGASALRSALSAPLGLATDIPGNFYIADTANHRIRFVDAISNNITTIAGTGTAGSSGDGAAASMASLNTPSGIVLDGAGNVYFCDTGNSAVRRIDHASGLITTVAGSLGTSGYSGDGGSATSALLNMPSSLVFDFAGNLFVADTGNNVIRKILAATGNISTIAGTGVNGFNGDGIPATTAELNSPQGLAIGIDGLLYISDTNNNRIRRVNPNGSILTVAGTGIQGYSTSANGSPQADAVEINSPTGIIFDPAGRFFFADSGNNVIREVDVVGNIATVAGTTHSAFYGDNGIAVGSGISNPHALTYDSNGNVFLADTANNRIRELVSNQVTVDYPRTALGSIAGPTYLKIENHGNVDLVLGSVLLNNAKLDPETGCAYGALIPPAHGCAIFLDFAPTTAGNPALGTASWTSNALDSPAVFTLSGIVPVAKPTITLTSSANPSLSTEALTFASMVASSGTSLGGSVTFFDGKNQLCDAVPLNDGAASCTFSSLTPGQHTIIASYSGDENDDPALSFPLTQIVKQSVTLSLSASPPASTVTNTVALKAILSGSSTTSTEAIAFFDGSTQIGTGTLDSTGRSVWSTQGFKVGTHVLSAYYNGDAVNGPAQSNTVALVVSLAATVTSMASNNAQGAIYKSPIMLTASVSSINGPLPTGSVIFSEGNVTLASGVLDSSGNSTITLLTLTPGTHTIVASYSGDQDNAASVSAPLVQQINYPLSPGLAGYTISVSPNPVVTSIGLTQIVQVTVTPTGGYAQPVTLGCENLPNEATCTFADERMPSGGGTTNLAVYVAFPHPCTIGSHEQGGSSATPLIRISTPILAGLFLLLIPRCRRRRLAGIGSTVILLGLLLSVEGCSSPCTDFGTTPGSYRFQVTGSSTINARVDVTLRVGF